MNGKDNIPKFNGGVSPTSSEGSASRRSSIRHDDLHSITPNLHIKFLKIISTPC